MSVLTSYNMKNNLRRVQPREFFLETTVFPVFPTAAVREYLQLFALLQLTGALSIPHPRVYRYL